MSEKGTIVVAEIEETKYGEEAIIDSPYEAKDYISALPWKTYTEEIDEHGSLKAKAESRGTNTKTSEMFELFEAMDEFGFSDEFATHVGWEPDALGGDGAWTIDKEAVPEAVNFWEFAGFDVEVEASLGGS